MGLGVGAAWVSGGARDMAGSACPFSPAFLSGHSRAPRCGIWAPMGVMGSAGSPCVPGGIPGLLACCPHPGLPLGGRRERRPVRSPWTGHCPRCPQGPRLEQPASRLPRGQHGPARPRAWRSWILRPRLASCCLSAQTPLVSSATQDQRRGRPGGTGVGPLMGLALAGEDLGLWTVPLCRVGVGRVLGGSHLFWLQQQVSGTAAPHRDPQAQRPLARPADAFPLPCRPGGPSGPASPRPGGHALSGGQRLADCHGKHCSGCRGRCFLSRCL